MNTLIITNNINSELPLSPSILISIVLGWLILVFLGYYLIRTGAKQKKTWKIVVGVILTGLIGLVYYINLREKIKSQESKEQIAQLNKKIDELKKEKEL